VNPDGLEAWTPIRSHWRGDQLLVDWCLTAGIDFTDPFFEQTIERCLRDPFRLLFQQETAIDRLGELAADGTAITPSGFIFHMSRCGSTVITQMLSRLQSSLVLSEPGPLDTVLWSPNVRPGIAAASLADWVRWMVAALGRRRAAGQRHLVVKLDAWAALALPFWRAVFPDTPWVFVTRNPVEVLVSQMSSTAHRMVQGSLPPDVLGLSWEHALSLPQEEYLSILLGRLCESVLATAGPGRLVVDYEELPGAVEERIAPLFGIEVQPGERPGFLEAAGRHAKNPTAAYADDAVRKRREATDAMREASARWADGPYRSVRTGSG
jgi:hypothetical protein